MSLPTAEQHAELTRFFKEWRATLEQAQAAAVSLEGWQVDARTKEARFKGAAEFVFGSTDVHFSFDEATGTLTFTQPNRAVRRAQKKVRR